MAPGAPKSPLRIVIHGTGRMGRSVFEAAAERSDLRVDALVGPVRPDWELPPATAWAATLGDLAGPPGLLIDFTLPEGTRAAAEWCARHAVPLLSGVTGLPEETHERLRHCGESVPVLWSPNLSLGVNLLADLAARAAAVIDPGAPVWIEDLHHRWKQDAPSGTALMLGAVIADRRDGDDSGIEYHSRREGEAIGEHLVRFTLAGEVIELRHRAGDRGIYARGALEAGLWLAGQAPGLYSAADWLAGA